MTIVDNHQQQIIQRRALLARRKARHAHESTSQQAQPTNTEHSGVLEGIHKIGIVPTKPSPSYEDGGTSGVE